MNSKKSGMYNLDVVWTKTLLVLLRLKTIIDYENLTL